MVKFTCVVGSIYVFNLFSFCRSELVDSEFSNSLLTLLDSALSGCSIHVMLNQRSAKSEANLANIVSYFEQSKTAISTFYLGSFGHSYHNNYIEGDFGKLFKGGNRVRPIWLFTLHSLCFSQIYFIDSENDIRTTILYYFVQAELAKLKPKYILLWDNAGPYNTNWTFYFNQQEFYGSLTDYRFHIGKETHLSLYEVKLICILCSSYEYSNPELKELISIQNPTKSQINKVWKMAHSNYYGLYIAFSCQSIGNNECERRDLFITVGQIFNASLYRVNGIQLNMDGFISDFLPFNPGNTYQFHTQAVWPGFYAIGSTITQKEYCMVTVIRKSDLLKSDLNSLLSVFDHDILVATVVIVMIIFLLLYNTRSNIKKNYSSFCLYVVGPMTDHWETIQDNTFTVRVVLLWSILCYSVTCLYSGEMASSLSVLLPPSHNASFGDLGENIVSFTTTLVNSYPSSMFGFELDTRIKIAEDNSTNAYVPNYILKISETNPGIVDRLYSTYCGSFTLTVLSRKDPIGCLSDIKNKFNFEKPLTILGEQLEIDRIEMVLESSQDFWVSSRTKLSMFTTITPVVFTKTYFAKLAEPIVKAWWASGLGQQRHRYRSVFYDSMAKRVFPIVASNEQLSRVYAFEPLNIRHFVTVATLWFYISCIAALSFVVEILCHIDVSSLTWRLVVQKIRHLGTSIQTIVTTI